MSNRENIFWYGWGVILITLFLLSSTNLIIKEKKYRYIRYLLLFRKKVMSFMQVLKKGWIRLLRNTGWT